MFPFLEDRIQRHTNKHLSLTPCNAVRDGCEDEAEDEGTLEETAPAANKASSPIPFFPLEG